METIKRAAHDYKLLRSKSEVVPEFTCKVKSLRENEIETIHVSRESSGQWLLDEVCERFGRIQEKDYFGLRYTDKEKQRQWLDLGRSVYHQLKVSNYLSFLSKKSQPIVVSFRLKHFPAQPLLDLNQEIACYYLYLQLRRDLTAGRLLGRSSDLYQLAAYAVQDERGDHDSEGENTTGYLSQLKLLPNLNSRTESKIVDLHKNLVGLTPPEARQKFLEKACQLDTYGVEPFYVKDQKGNNLYVGLTHEGVSTFQGSRRAHLFRWGDIYKILFKGKLYIIHVYLDEIYNNQLTKRKHVLGFKCESSLAAEALWKWSNDRMCFFSLNRSSEAKRVKSGGGILRRQKTFKFAGRCQKEIQNISRSMNCLDMSDPANLSRRGTLVRTNAINDEDNEELRNKFNSMPNRDKGKMLGTQDTLDSLFMHQQQQQQQQHQQYINGNINGHTKSQLNYISPEGSCDLGHVEMSYQQIPSNNSLEHIVEEQVSPGSMHAQHTSLDNNVCDEVDYSSNVGSGPSSYPGQGRAQGDTQSDTSSLVKQQKNVSRNSVRQELCSICSSRMSSNIDLTSATDGNYHFQHHHPSSDISTAIDELQSVLRRQNYPQQQLGSHSDKLTVVSPSSSSAAASKSILCTLVGLTVKLTLVLLALLFLASIFDGQFTQLPQSPQQIRQRLQRVFSRDFFGQAQRLTTTIFSNLADLVGYSSDSE